MCVENKAGQNGQKSEMTEWFRNKVVPKGQTTPTFKIGRRRQCETTPFNNFMYNLFGLAYM